MGGRSSPIVLLGVTSAAVIALLVPLDWATGNRPGSGSAHSPRQDSAPSPTAVPRANAPPAPGPWTLKFRDEFMGSRLNRKKWRPNWLGTSDRQITKPVNSGELSCYHPAQVRVGGGVATLSLVRRSCRASNGATYRYRSGLIQSSNHYLFRYGYMEARMWLPPGTGTPVDWPAFWAVGTGPWPSTGEIDVMEVVRSRLCWHFHNLDGASAGCPRRFKRAGWHTFAADWEPGSITFYYDGVTVGQVTSGVTSAAMFLIANLGIGNGHGLGGPRSHRARAAVDYIRVWQR